MTLPAPRGDDVITDMATRLGQLWRQAMSNDERAEVVLARDVPEGGGRDAPSDLHAAPLRDEGVEVITGWAEPLRGRSLRQAVGSFTGQVRLPHRCRRPDQAR